VPGIVAILAYLAGLAAFLLYVLIAIWPTSSPAELPPATEEVVPRQTIRQESPEPRDVTFFGVTWKMWDEQRLLILVMTAGALGSLVHALRSAYWYVGNRANPVLLQPAESRRPVHDPAGCLRLAG
jgi:hypothetical protein